MCIHFDVKFIKEVDGDQHYRCQKCGRLIVQLATGGRVEYPTDEELAGLERNQERER